MSTTIRKLATNALSTLSSDVVNRASTFVVYALIARRLGTHEFGQISLALTLFYAFTVFAVMGLRTLVTREVARDPARAATYLVNGSVVTVASSLLSLALLLGFVSLMDYARDTSTVILLVCAGILPFSLAAVSEGVLRGSEEMKYIAYAQIPAHTMKVLLVLVMLSLGHGIYAVALALLIPNLLIVIAEWFFVRRYVTHHTSASIHFSELVALVRSARTFLGIEAIIAAIASINIILLSYFLSESQVGLYSAAFQLMLPLSLVYHNVVLSIFPLMVRRFESSFRALRQVVELVEESFLALALPSVVTLYVLAAPILTLVYGEAFREAAEVMRIVACVLIFDVLTIVLGQVLLASLREKAALRVVAVNAAVAVAAGFLLIWQFGLVGAAVAAVLVQAVDLVQHYLAVRMPVARLAVLRIAWRPTAAGAVMVLFLAIAHDIGSVGALISGFALYCSAFFALTLLSVGGPRQLKARYALLRSQ